MQLSVLGCRAGMPADGQASSGYLVDTPSARILLDCGPGIATALSAVLAPAALDAVVISHLHSDHCYDLLPVGKSLLSLLTMFPGGPAVAADEFRPVRLFAPVGAPERFRRWAALFPVAGTRLLDRAFEVAFEVCEYKPGDRATVGDCELEMHALRHVEPSCGVRVAAPSGTLAYTGDTGMTDAATVLAQGADLLLAEATLSVTDRTEHGHLSGGDAGRIAARAGVGELMLTHFASVRDDWLQDLAAAAAAEFPGPVRLARPGLVHPVGPGAR